MPPVLPNQNEVAEIVGAAATFFPSTSGVRPSFAMSLICESLKPGYNVGLALHFFADPTQPMYAWPGECW